MAAVLAIAVISLSGCGGETRTASSTRPRSEPVPGVVFGGESAAVLRIEPAQGSNLGASELAQFKRGRFIAVQEGCTACHEFGEQGNPGPGPQLTHIAGRLPRTAIRISIQRPIAPMPNQHLSPPKLRALVAFLSALR